MIEDPNITLDILKYFASDEISWPANLDDRQIKNHFKNIPHRTVDYHLICAIDSELLRGAYTRHAVAGGAFYTFGRIDGLTVEGGEYVRNAAGSKVWDRAKCRLIEAGVEVTTQNLMLAIPEVIVQLVKQSSS